MVLHHVLCGLPESRREIFCCSFSQPEVVFKAGSVPAIPEWQETGSCFAFFFDLFWGLLFANVIHLCNWFKTVDLPLIMEHYYIMFYIDHH